MAEQLEAKEPAYFLLHPGLARLSGPRVEIKV